MAESAQGRWEGHGPDLHGALQHAWENARGGGADPGLYEVYKIFIETENPIRTYIVTIGPPE